MDQKTCWGLCQCSVAWKQEAFPKPSREPVWWLPPGTLSTLGKTSGMAGKGPLAPSQQETRVPRFSQTFSSAEGKEHGGSCCIPTRKGWLCPRHLKVAFDVEEGDGPRGGCKSTTADGAVLMGGCFSCSARAAGNFLVLLPSW